MPYKHCRISWVSVSFTPWWQQALLPLGSNDTNEVRVWVEMRLCSVESDSISPWYNSCIGSVCQVAWVNSIPAELISLQHASESDVTEFESVLLRILAVLMLRIRYLCTGAENRSVFKYTSSTCTLLVFYVLFIPCKRFLKQFMNCL
jgi:hypothetical protein